eukprot:2934837-Ditylum_brightwellii.AAC.2
MTGAICCTQSSVVKRQEDLVGNVDDLSGDTLLFKTIAGTNMFEKEDQYLSSTLLSKEIQTTKA